MTVMSTYRPIMIRGARIPSALRSSRALLRDRKDCRKLVRDRRRARHLVEGAGDLAQELARAGGQETVRVAHARAELLRLRGIG